MENFRLFLIRLLQILWILTMCATAFGVMIEASINSGFAMLLIFGVPLLILQYLIFADIDPRNLFNGKIKENLLK